LCHNIADAQGRKALHKGRVVRPADLAQLAALGHETVRVAVLAADDVHENLAAARLAQAVAGSGVRIVGEPHAGRVNVAATQQGPLQVDVAALLALNDLDGLTVATLPAHTLVQPGQQLATIKVIPFAVPEALLAQAEQIGAQTHGVISVPPLRLRQIGVVLVSSASARGRVERGVLPAIAGRIADLGGRLHDPLSVLPDESAIAAAIAALYASGVELIIVAGETSVMDLDDVTPAGVRLAGGQIEHFGAPVEPGNLLLLAYLAAADQLHARIPVIGAPGCVRSRDANIVDLLLPRLMAGEHVRRRDVVALGHGGLLG
jgi:molybdopterin biosynthesis enzyme